MGGQSCSLQNCILDCKMNLPLGCEVVGQNEIFTNGVFCEVDFYIKGHQELSPFWRVTFVDGKSGIETRVSVSRGPSENFYG